MDHAGAALLLLADGRFPAGGYETVEQVRARHTPVDPGAMAPRSHARETGAP